MEDQVETPQEKKTGINAILIVAALLVLGLGALYAFTRTNSSNQVNPSMSPGSSDSADDTSMTFDDSETLPPGDTGNTGDSDTDTQTIANEQTFEIEGGSFYYKPNEIRVKQGDTVTINMKSVDMMHDFNIDELGVKMPIVNSGDTGTVTFTATQKGTFEFYCSVGQHRANGQVGTLIVE